MSANGKALYPQPTFSFPLVIRYRDTTTLLAPHSPGFNMVALTNDIFVKHPLPAPLYRARMFILDKDDNYIGGMGVKEGLKTLDTRKRFTVDFRAA
jgi:hypothetical protein